MRLAFGCDHAGHPLKEPIIAALEQDGHHVLDLGTFSSDPVDYPDFARAVGSAVRNGFVDLGILVCGSGVGGAIAANKVRGVRAALDDDANVLCLGARVLDAETAMEIILEWLATEFSGEERHVRRVQKIAQLEQGFPGPAAEKTVRREVAARPAPLREEEPPPRARPPVRPASTVEEPPPRRRCRRGPARGAPAGAGPSGTKAPRGAPATSAPTSTTAPPSAPDARRAIRPDGSRGGEDAGGSRVHRESLD
ncbi:MAG: RpiB/LacA/LacB family sugar-phosphate isomerase [Candidatus Rokubacteria bacterium]|nr:RpiB/LacA/LacB family sugar-phosphate isomerase [Candidatus Rokubacteria bacterium]